MVLRQDITRTVVGEMGEVTGNGMSRQEIASSIPVTMLGNVPSGVRVIHLSETHHQGVRCRSAGLVQRGVQPPDVISDRLRTDRRVMKMGWTNHVFIGLGMLHDQADP